MASLTATIKALLARDESTTLDFKRDQYPFANATDNQKSEVIKDILAFANAFRDQDAYILLGITEGHPAHVTGITNHLNDAHLQQLINTKTNRPVEFSYHALRINGKDIAAIRIPEQARPTFLTKSYGKLHANTVYLRHGSSTSIATPDEIARMGTPDAPTLDLHFADTNERQLKRTHRSITSTVLRTPKNIPENDTIAGLVNPNYHRESITQATFAHFTKPISIAITNTSSVTAHDVHITLAMPDPTNYVTITLDTPPTPNLFRGNRKPPKLPKHQVTVQRTNSTWHMTARLAKVQPHATQHLPDLLYLGATRSTTLTITATMHADNLPTPITSFLTIKVTSKQRKLNLQQAIKLAHKT